MVFLILLVVKPRGRAKFNANFVPSNLNSLLGDNTTVTHEEVQAGNVITGNYKLGHNTKVALAWNNPASVMDTDLESLSSDNIIINVDVTRQRVDKALIWTVTYANKSLAPGSGNIDDLTCDTDTLTPGSTCVVTEVQGFYRVSGTFELNFENAPDGPVHMNMTRIH